MLLGYPLRGSNSADRLAKIFGGMVSNRFYLGELLDDNGGWVRARHEAVIEEIPSNDAQKAPEGFTRPTACFTTL